MNDLQRTPEWHAARLGKLTGSRIADATARTKTGWGASRANYMAELLIERLTGRPTEHYETDAMRWGTQFEPEALAVYESRSLDVIALTGFVPHPDILMSGCSPDGLVADDGMVEIKCPNTSTHIDTVLGASIDERYIKQMQWQMACAGRAWCDWVSYDPRLPEKVRIVIRRVDRDDKLIAKLEGEAGTFLAELAEKCQRLSAIVDGRDDTTLRQLQASVAA